MLQRGKQNDTEKEIRINEIILYKSGVLNDYIKLCSGYIYTVKFYLFEYLIPCIFVQVHSCFKMGIYKVCIPIF